MTEWYLLGALLAVYFSLTIWRKGRNFLAGRYARNAPYKVFCRDFDVQISADQLDRVLGPSEPSASQARSEALDNGLAGWRVRNDFAALETAARIRAATPQEVLTDSIVSLLIDHSGSMKGQAILLAAGTVVVASDMLEGLGVKQEVLGFTTVRWQGGESRKRWLREGRVYNPGRLNDVLHIVYSAADEGPRERSCAAMLHPDLLKENIDGEAIEWAASRLRKRPERQKYIIVISDGAPVDDSTLQANTANYLEKHLLSVIQSIAETGDIGLSAIGIGHAVDRYYEHSARVNTPDDLGEAVLALLEDILTPEEAVPAPADRPVPAG
jgi:cobaltochelatase CobT